MAHIKFAVAYGDGSGPEMVLQALRCMENAAAVHGLTLHHVETPLGWSAYDQYGDTTPEESIRKIMDIGLLFFGGVGDPKFDNTIGVEKPEMKPEARALLRLRKDMGLLLNFRPVVFLPELQHLTSFKSSLIPAGGINTDYVRFLLEDSYFGNESIEEIMKVTQQGRLTEDDVREMLGIKLKPEVTGQERVITDIGYYTRTTLVYYFRSVFTYARQRGFSVLSCDKANVVPRYVLWRKVATEVAAEFPDVEFLGSQYVDSLNARLFNPQGLNRTVVACGNEHGDIISDGAATSMGSLGLMHSSAVNPETGAAMFESGAGTAPDLAGQDKANPLGRILSGAMLLRHAGAEDAAETLEKAVWQTLKEGWRTPDIAEEGCQKLVGCEDMAFQVCNNIQPSD